MAIQMRVLTDNWFRSGDFFRIVTQWKELIFRADDIAWIETPTSTGKPAGWRDGIAAVVSIRGCIDLLYLDASQWGELANMLGFQLTVKTWNGADFTGAK